MTPVTKKQNKVVKEVEKLPTHKGMQAQIYNSAGVKTGTIELPESIFGVKWNPDLVHQVVVSMQANARRGLAHTKDRGEVRGGGRKPWQQKGTGRARHGSIRSPLWKGGGVTHGPRKEKVYTKKINRKMRQVALFSALSRKYKDGEVIFIDVLHIEKPKASVAKGVLAALSNAGFSALSGKKNNAALIALARSDKTTQKSFANFRNVETSDVNNLNAVSVLSSKYLIIAEPRAALEKLSQKRLLVDKAAKNK